MNNHVKKEKEEEIQEENSAKERKGKQAATATKEEEIVDVDDGVDYKRLEDDACWYSDQISKSVRWLSIAVIGGIWSILTADRLVLSDSTAGGFTTSQLIATAFILASLSLVLDLSHYIAAYCATSSGIDRWEIGFKYSVQYLGRSGHILYVASRCLFWSKLIVATIAGVVFCLIASAIQLTIEIP